MEDTRTKDALTKRLESLVNASMDEQMNNPLIMYVVTHAIERCTLALLLLRKV
ncbi:hypothetical protein [Listeria booriae]|uniref:hypothetical protein n=1 Tax=Listeria booriae TaxID=1552123 RepID=UPI00163DBE05|nr:hypothetical protein [Listeria booriae]MBC1306820.1 hypothetical protein [Listeria booriae]